MKFLKSTIAIVALLAIGSVSAKVMKKQGQTVVQPTVQPASIENAITAYIDQIFNENDEELRDMLLINFNDYEEKDICEFIGNLGQFIKNQFPHAVLTAKRLFKEKMMGFCDSIKNNKARIMFIQDCIDKSMMTGRGMRPERRNESRVRRNMNK